MRDFEIKRNPDGSWSLLEPYGDKLLTEDKGQDPIQVWATARTDSGELFYVRLPVKRAMLEHEPEVIEQRLRLFAEQWESSRQRGTIMDRVSG